MYWMDEVLSVDWLLVDACAPCGVSPGLSARLTALNGKVLEWRNQYASERTAHSAQIENVNNEGDSMVIAGLIQDGLKENLEKGSKASIDKR